MPESVKGYIILRQNCSGDYDFLVKGKWWGVFIEWAETYVHPFDDIVKIRDESMGWEQRPTHKVSATYDPKTGVIVTGPVVEF